MVMTQRLSHVPPSLVLGLLCNGALLSRPGNRGLLRLGYLALHGCYAEYGCLAYACPFDPFRKVIVELSPDYPLCTLPYVFLSKIPEKRGGDRFPLETVI